ncbi:MAG: hypothetical protein ACFFDN_44545, partial [Candidatus Hodarchaeota archaeon]
PAFRANTMPYGILPITSTGDWESKECINTINVKNGNVTIKPPEIETLIEVNESMMIGNFLLAMMRR